MHFTRRRRRPQLTNGEGKADEQVSLCGRFRFWLDDVGLHERGHRCRGRWHERRRVRVVDQLAISGSHGLRCARVEPEPLPDQRRSLRRPGAGNSLDANAAAAGYTKGYSPVCRTSYGYTKGNIKVCYTVGVLSDANFQAIGSQWNGRTK